MRLVRSRALAVVGLLGVGLVGVKLWTGDLAVTQAGARVAVLTAALVGTERVLVPLARALVTTGRRTS